MKVLIGADLVPTQTNEDLFAAGDAQALVGDELYQLLRSADYRVFNLEVPLTDQEKPTLKCGPNLIAHTKCIEGYKAMQVNLLTLANNHILDQDQQGLKSTCAVLDAAEIAYTGVGKTPKEAAQPHIFECDGKRIGIYACAEHEFSIVTDHSPGANPIDLLESPDHVAALKAQCDFVVVLYHGGKEHYRYPSPNLQKVCRKLVEKGADLVVCQHSHCIGCEEKYKSGIIVYGQGNFLFDRSESEFWQTSLLVSIGDDFAISYIPLVKRKNTVAMAEGEQADKILSDFQRRSEEIQKNGFIESSFAQLVEEYGNSLLLSISGHSKNLLYRILNKASGNRFWDWHINRLFRGKTACSALNRIECEPLREILIAALKRNDRNK